MHKTPWLILLLLSFTCIIVHAQDLQEQANELSLSNNLSTDPVLFENQLNYYKQHPIDLNNTSEAELASLLILNMVQINNLIFHIKANGELIDIYELQTIEGFDLKTIQKLLPYIRINNSRFVDEHQDKKNEIILRSLQTIEKREGYNLPDSSKSKYKGDPRNYFIRYKHYSKSSAFGITAEQDEGESFSTKGFDFYSGYWQYNFNQSTSVIIGDYHLGFGQGLALNNGFLFRKTTGVLNTKLPNYLISPHTSADEANFFRGLVGHTRSGNWHITSFYSNREKDAITNNDSITSISYSGLHITKTQLTNQNNINEQLAGMHLAFNTNTAYIGITGLYQHFSKAFSKNNSPQNKFDFVGKESIIMSSNYSYAFKNVLIFGELAIDQHKSYAIQSNFTLSISKEIAFTLMHRNYETGYQALHANAFGENYNNTNEKGLYLGILLNPSKTIELNFYFDNFNFPWLQYRISQPSNGYDFLGAITWNPNKQLSISSRYRQEHKTKDFYDYLNYTNTTQDYTQYSSRNDITFVVSKSVTLHSRMDLSNFDNNINTFKGFFFGQDINWQPKNKKWGIKTRFALFDIDDYNSRIYTTENDLPNSYSIPALDNKGKRYYIQFNYRITEQFKIWIRFSQTSYDNLKSIGYGSEEIKGNTLSDLKAQVQYSF